METEDERFLRQAIALAWQGREQGGDPIGAVLVRDGAVVLQTVDRCVATSDPTYHAELSLISDYCRAHQVFSLAGFSLYTSAEPCPMCAGAIHWARISRLVFSMSQAMIQTRSGGRPKLPCTDILHPPQIEVIGPLLPEEGLAVFEGYPFTPKIARHAARFQK
jgi:tRNA(Arg) A34 adenosine deaminase TadA